MRLGISEGWRLNTVIRNCTIDGGTATATKAAIGYDDGYAEIRDCIIQNVGVATKYRGAGAAIAGANLIMTDCDVKCGRGILLRPGVTLTYDQNTMRCVYNLGLSEPEAFNQYAFREENRITLSIVTGFHWIILSGAVGCTTPLVSYNIFFENTYTGPVCPIDPLDNLFGVDPLFCDEQDATIGGSTLRIDSPAFADNNVVGYNIGYFNGEKCSWGTLARNTVVEAERVRVLEDTIVPIGKSLTIEAGATLEFDGVDNSSSGVDIGRNELIVDNGTLYVNGTETNPVSLKSSAVVPAAGNWFGVVVKNGGDAYLTNCDIKHTDYGLYVPDLGDIVQMTDCNISEFGSTGIRVDNSGPGGAATDLLVSGGSIDVTDGLQGIYLLKAASAVVENVAITGDYSSWYGVYLDAATNPTYHYEVNDCSISGFGTGTGVYAYWHAPFIRGNTITSCKWGIQLRGPNVPRVETNPVTEQETTISLCTTGIYSPATAIVDGAHIASPAGGTGLYVDGTSYGDYSNLEIVNGAIGVQASTSNGVAQLRESTVTQFTTNGVKYGVMGLDLGTAAEHGNNNIHSTVSGTGKFVLFKTCVDGGPTIPAEYNYWGASTPDPSKFSTCVDYTPYLTSSAAAAWFNPLSVDIVPATRGLRAEPNPFRGDVQLSFAVAQQGHSADLEVFDVTGRLVQVLASGPLAAGEYTVRWDGRNTSGLNVPRGLYFVRLRTGEVTTTQKIVRVQ